MKQYILIYISLALSLAGILGLVISFIFLKKEKKRNKFTIFSVVVVMIAFIIYGIGDKVKRSMFKTETLRYYNEEIDYVDMDDKQKTNIQGSIFFIEELKEEEIDVYLPVYKHYMTQMYESMGYDEKEINEHIYKFYNDYN